MLLLLALRDDKLRAEFGRVQREQCEVQADLRLLLQAEPTAAQVLQLVDSPSP